MLFSFSPPGDLRVGYSKVTFRKIGRLPAYNFLLAITSFLLYFFDTYITLSFQPSEFQIPPSIASVICPLPSDICHLTSVIHLRRYPDIVSDIQFNLIACRCRINGSEGGARSLISSIRNTVFELDMTISGQHHHDIIF